jgi:hypothetical protein
LPSAIGFVDTKELQQRGRYVERGYAKAAVPSSAVIGSVDGEDPERRPTTIVSRTLIA